MQNVTSTGSHGPFIDRLRDFSADRRLLLLVAMALVVGTAGAAAAWVLLHLINLATNLAYYGRISAAPTSIIGNPLGYFAALVPVVGCLIIGLMARYGSEKIRGHGIPEAMEAILIGRSRIQPKVAILKPLSSAISIGSGGPFGAEGPIIMTGGAFGSLFAQFFHLSDAERKTLLVAGAAAGMAATFGTPVAAMLLAVELLLFEWKPRSFVPVAIACVVAAAWRPWLMGAGVLFPMVPSVALPPVGLLFAAALGCLAGLASGLLTQMVYRSEDLFQSLPIHWMWWPVFGGALFGVMMPVGEPGLWALIGMAAMMAGTMRSPLTSIIFAIELTHNLGGLLRLATACAMAHATMVLLLRRSILTEKVARRGHHVSREYIIDPFETMRVSDIMAKSVDTFAMDAALGDVVEFFSAPDAPRRHKSYPVIDGEGRVLRMIARADVFHWIRDGSPNEETLGEMGLDRELITGYDDELVGQLADRMAAADISRIPILRRSDDALVGLVARRDLLRVRARAVKHEQEREILIRVRPQS